MLTLENLKRLEPSSSSPLSSPTSPTTSSFSEADDESLFSAARGAPSSASSAPEDEQAPFQVTDTATGEQLTVYSSLEQAVRYSMIRTEAARRQQSAGVSWSALSMAAAAAAVADDEEEVDEDAYFSMG
jgi:hypothetical protein